MIALGKIGPDACESVPALCEVLRNDEEPTVRRRATVALGEIGAEAAIPSLEEAYLHDDNEEVQDVIAAALAEIEGKSLDAAA